MGQVFVRASRRARAYTRTSSKRLVTLHAKAPIMSKSQAAISKELRARANARLKKIPGLGGVKTVSTVTDAKNVIAAYRRKGWGRKQRVFSITKSHGLIIK